MCTCACVWVCGCKWEYLWSPKENIRSPGAVVTGNRDLPEVGAGNKFMSSAKEVCSLVRLTHLQPHTSMNVVDCMCDCIC